MYPPITIFRRMVATVGAFHCLLLPGGFDIVRVGCCLEPSGSLVAQSPENEVPAEDGRAKDRLPFYQVHRVLRPPEIDGRLDEAAWFTAPATRPFHFPWLQQGKAEQSVVKLLWDDEFLYMAHICQDNHITARYKNHNDPIPQDDCFEIMFAPDSKHPERYFNIEWNVLGGYIDGHRPAGPKGPRVEWDVQGLRMAGSVVGTLNNDRDLDEQWTVELAIPWHNFRNDMPHAPPEPGHTWRVNFNRHGGLINQQYSQWSAGDTPAPAFHVPHRFGTLRFVADCVPFPP